jgi:DNA-binding FrmR family transcriptional regulator
MHKTHPDIIPRLKRAEGHLRSVITMIEDGKSCLDIAQQLHAVEAAIAKAKQALIHDHIEHCLEEGHSVETKAAIEELKAITKFL